MKIYKSTKQNLVELAKFLEDKEMNLFDLERKSASDIMFIENEISKYFNCKIEWVTNSYFTINSERKNIGEIRVDIRKNVYDNNLSQYINKTLILNKIVLGHKDYEVNIDLNDFKMIEEGNIKGIIVPRPANWNGDKFEFDSQGNKYDRGKIEMKIEIKLSEDEDIVNDKKIIASRKNELLKMFKNILDNPNKFKPDPKRILFIKGTFI